MHSRFVTKWPRQQQQRMVDEPDVALRTSTQLHLLSGGSLEFGSFAAAQRLVQDGADPNAANCDGLTAVHIAAAWGNYEMLKLLLLNGGDPKQMDSSGKDAFTYARENREQTCLDLLNDWMNQPRSSQPPTPRYGHSPLPSNCSAASSSYTPKYFPSPLRCENVITPSSRERHHNVIEPPHHVFQHEDVRRSLDFSKATSSCSSDETAVSALNKAMIESSLGDSGNDDKDTSDPLARFNSSLMSHDIDVANPYVDQGNRYVISIGNAASKRTSAICDSATKAVPRASYGAVIRVSECRSGALRSTTSVWENETQSTQENTQSTQDDSVLSQGTELGDVPDAAFLKSVQSLNRTELRELLEMSGFHNIGPITNNTRWLYDRRLALALQNDQQQQQQTKPRQSLVQLYSPQLQSALRGELDWQAARTDERLLMESFDNTKDRAWREGLEKSSFCYALIDPRNLDLDMSWSSHVDDSSLLEDFCRSIFYVGKGKNARPFQHLYDADAAFVSAAKASDENHDMHHNAKVRRILDIWGTDVSPATKYGVISLNLFQNVLAVEAYTREAALIDALGLRNLTNLKRGDYYGVACTWPLWRKRRLGTYLLRKALRLFAVDKGRQLRPGDIKGKSSLFGTPKTPQSAQRRVRQKTRTPKTK